ncbi:PREDICTED: uncharacterized protein LOC102835003 [Chrysochloris asiatica]|uniref:Uncharacterized protein LOC102835003 n=1 Tax=Chrysochloris asiatica TaxID=185453 RepID=A0A9B0TW16_CHRAS|nr:PREDICTED: uncharacterized protein LOC102835003 [Chrysochloris asiatica]
MALNPEDRYGGFHHAEVVAFINKKIRGHVKGPEFYLENMSLPWEEVEDKLRATLEDSEVPSDAKEACAWGSLALGVRSACKQSQLQRRKIQWLHDLSKLHKSASQTLATNLKELTAQQELERKEAALQQQMLQTSLAEVQKERDQLKRKLLMTELWQPLESTTLWPSLDTVRDPGKEEVEEEQEEVERMWPCIATVSGDGTKGVGKEEEKLVDWVLSCVGGAGTEGEGEEEVEVVDRVWPCMTSASGVGTEGEGKEEAVDRLWTRVASASGVGTEGKGKEQEEVADTMWPGLTSTSGAVIGEAKEEKEVVITMWLSLSTANGAGIEGESKEEEKLVDTVWPCLAISGGAWIGGKGEQKEELADSLWPCVTTASGGETEEGKGVEVVDTVWSSLTTFSGAGAEGNGEGKEEVVGTVWSSLTTVGGAGIEGEGKEEEEVVAPAATIAAANDTGGEEEMGAASAVTSLVTKVSQEAGGTFLQLSGAMEQKKITSGRQREELGSLETARFYFPGAVKSEPTIPQQLELTTLDSYNCMKYKFQLLQAWYHSLKLEYNKLAREKLEMQHYYVMSYNMNIKMHKKAEIRKRLNGQCPSPTLPVNKSTNNKSWEPSRELIRSTLLS